MKLLWRAARQWHRSVHLTPVKVSFSTTPKIDGLQTQGDSFLSAFDHPIQLPNASNSTTSEPQYNQTSNKIILSKVAQKAAFASKIIELILKSGRTHTVQQSLRDQIIGLNTDSFQFHLDDECKKDVLRLFTTGIQPNQTVFCGQQRVQKSLFDQKLTFFPTTTVSKLIFQSIQQNPDIIIMGSFGIGKTMSIILFIYLAKYVNELRYLAYGYWVPQKRRKDFKKQLEQLEKLKLISNTPKLWYWSIKRELKQTEDDVKKLVLAQIDQLNLPNQIKKQLQGIKSLKDLCDRIKMLHELPRVNQKYGNNQTKSIPVFTKMAIDQVNFLSSYFTILNDSIKNEIDKGKSVLQVKKQLAQTIFRAQDTKRLIKQFHRLGPSWVLNSSQQLEKKLILYCPIYRIYYSLWLINHGDPAERHFSYAKKLKEKNTVIEFYQFFLFLLELQFKFKNLQKEFELAKKHIQIDKLQAKMYYRVLYIHQFLAQNKRNLFQKVIRAKNLQSQEEMQKVFAGIFESFNEFCKKRSIMELQQFLQNNKASLIFKNVMLQAFQYVALKKIHKKDQNFIVDAISLQEIIQKHCTSHEKFEDISVQEYITSSYENSALLPCFFNFQKRTIVFDYTPSEFLDIAYPVIFKRLQKQAPNKLISQDVFNLLQKRSKTVGDNWERVLLRLLISSQSVQLKICNKIDKQSKKREFETFQQKIDGLHKYYPLNSNYELNKEPNKERKNQENETEKQSTENIVSISHNFKHVLEVAEKNPGKNIFGMPQTNYTQNQSFENFDDKSKVFDFMCAKYSDKQNRFNLSMFDVITTDISKKKLEESKKLLQQLINGEEKAKFKIRLVVICPYQQYQAPQRVDENLNVEYCSLSGVDFTGGNNYKIYGTFRILTELVKQKFEDQ